MASSSKAGAGAGNKGGGIGEIQVTVNTGPQAGTSVVERALATIPKLVKRAYDYVKSLGGGEDVVSRRSKRVKTMGKNLLHASAVDGPVANMCARDNVESPIEYLHAGRKHLPQVKRGKKIISKRARDIDSSDSDGSD